MLLKIWKWINELGLIYRACKRLTSKEYRDSIREDERAYILGQRAAHGKNIYLTFGSEKTSPKSAEDSYRRYAMAMKHYNGIVCDMESFVQGYNNMQKKMEVL